MILWYFWKLPSHPGCHITLGKVPCAIQTLLVIHFQHSRACIWKEMIQMNLFTEQKQTHRFRLGWTGNHMNFEGVEKARKWEVDMIMMYCPWSYPVFQNRGDIFVLKKQKNTKWSLYSQESIRRGHHTDIPCMRCFLRAGEGVDRGWDGWMASPTQWTWVWVNSGSWWWTGRPGVLQFMGTQRVGHDCVTELNWTEYLILTTGGGKYYYLYFIADAMKAQRSCTCGMW